MKRISCSSQDFHHRYTRLVLDRIANDRHEHSHSLLNALNVLRNAIECAVNPKSRAVVQKSATVDRYVESKGLVDAELAAPSTRVLHDAIDALVGQALGKLQQQRNQACQSIS